MESDAKNPTKRGCVEAVGQPAPVVVDDEGRHRVGHEPRRDLGVEVRGVHARIGAGAASPTLIASSASARSPPHATPIK